MRSPPEVIILPHLHDVVHDVALLMLEPDIQAKLADKRLSGPVRFRSLESNERPYVAFRKRRIISSASRVLCSA
jgi:hypothetical protein